jgi:hypothetical protein
MIDPEYEKRIRWAFLQVYVLCLRAVRNAILAIRYLLRLIAPAAKSNKLAGDVRPYDGKFGNFRHSAWRRFVPSPSTARANRAGLPETRERGKLASNPEAIWGMSDKALLGRRSCVSS